MKSFELIEIGKKFIGTHSVEELVKNLKTPRRVMMMVQAGNVRKNLDTSILTTS